MFFFRKRSRALKNAKCGTAKAKCFLGITPPLNAPATYAAIVATDVAFMG